VIFIRIDILLERRCELSEVVKSADTGSDGAFGGLSTGLELPGGTHPCRGLDKMVSKRYVRCVGAWM
jgi:hypothetical protein